MKKLFFAALVALVTVGGLSSCKKCQTCVYNDGSYTDEVDVCRGGSGPIYNAAYNAEIASYESSGYTCN